MNTIVQGISSAAGSVWMAGGGPAGAVGSRVVPQTPSDTSHDESESENDGQGSPTSDSAPAVTNRKFQFKCEGGTLKTVQGITDPQEYIKAVTSFSGSPFVGRQSVDAIRSDASSRSGMMLHVPIGLYTVQEICEVVRDAADVAGFNVYEHKGHCDRVYGNRCTLKFACDCGRKRHGIEKMREAIEHCVDLETVVRNDCRKKKSARRGHGYDPASTMHRRCKNDTCPFQFSIISYQNSVKFDVAAQSEWQLSSHARAVHNFAHVGHTLRTTGRIKLSEAAKAYIVSSCHEISIPQLVEDVARMFRIDTNRDAVRWILRANHKEAFQGMRSRVRGAGHVTETVMHLLKKQREIICLLARCSTGVWVTARPSLQSGSICYKLSEYQDRDSTSRSATEPRPMLAPDPDRVVVINEDPYFVHTMAWNYPSEKKKFEAYPHVVQMDCQANVTNNTDGFNCVGVDGNYHNIILLRAFIGSQKAEMFRWMLRVAFPALIPNYAKIRTFICDGCDALLGELKTCCIVNGPFPLAQVLLCIFHLLIQAFDVQFGFALRRATGAAPWFEYFRKALFTLKRCQTVDEFEECKTFFLSVAAGWPEIDGCPKVDLLKFLIARMNMPELWVLCYHKACCTRGCQATPRVEGEHGHSRNAGVNARCSWLLVVCKYDKILNRRCHGLLKWSDKQISRSLARTVTNPEMSTLSPSILISMDSFALPWALDSAELQMLFGRKEGLRCVYTMCVRDKHFFAIFFEGEEAEDDVPVAPEEASTTHREAQRSPCDSSEDETAPDSDDERATEKHARVEIISVLDEDASWDASMQDDLDFALKHPVSPNTRFCYKKIHKIEVLPDPNNVSKVLIMCDCGYASRIGLACYHTWCFLFTILKAIPSAGVFHCADCKIRPTTCETCKMQAEFQDFSWAQHPLFAFEDMFNLNIVSKIKYHAVLRPDCDASFFFNANGAQHNVFHPRISTELFQLFVRSNEPEGISRLPHAGLPDNAYDSPDESDHDDGAPMQSSTVSRSSNRRIIPTLPSLNFLLQGMWERTNRMTDKKRRDDARSIIGKHMNAANDELNSLHVDVAPPRLHRYHSVRDRRLGVSSIDKR